MSSRWRTLLITSALTPFAVASAAAGPNGATIVGGAATVQGQGTANVVVNQSSQSAIINWQTFNIGAGEKTTIAMPSSTSAELDRVTGGLGPSQIFGALTSNGRVFLVNPDGILFGQGARVNVGSLLATTSDIANSDFMAGRYTFSIPGNPNASIVNLGGITAQTGGFAALVAPGVRNAGVITARLGTIALASGNAFTLDMYGDNLITLGLNDSIASQVIDVSTGKPLSSLVGNSGKLTANGGTVVLTAVAAREVVDSVINNTGVIEANSIGTHNGMIVLGAATAASKPAGAPTQTVKVSGRLSTAGRHKGTTGGTIEVTGENVDLANATIDASGEAGGGAVLIGGDWGGGNPNTSLVSNPSAYLEPFTVPTATTVSVDAATVINASATSAGNGGKVIVWSKGATIFNGAILAEGGAQSGGGGFVETSGHQLSVAGAVNTSAPAGKVGAWLLDPLNATIAATPGSEVITISSIENALATGDVVVTTVGTTGSEAGDITVASNLSWNTPSGLLLAANRNVVIDNGVTIAADTANGASIILEADALGTGSGTVIFNGTASVVNDNVLIFYNPPGGYANPTNYNAWVSATALIAYMLVNNVNDLENVSQNLSGMYALGKNINAAGVNFVPIGDAANPFQGNFSGGININNLIASGGPSTNSEITNLTITSSLPDVGLFGVIGPTGIVQNLTLNNVSLNATGYDVGAGALASTNGGLVSNVYVTGSVHVATGSNVGGLVGENSGHIFQSGAAVNVGSNSGIYSFGGLVGDNSGVISQSYATGSVSGGNSNGGLVGYSAPGSEIIQSYATGLAGNYGNLGGLVGWTWSATIEQSYATGGNLVGANFALSGSSGSVYTNSYWDLTNTAGQTSSAGGTAIMDATLKSGLPSGFDPTVWGSNPSINNGYPYLLWQTASASTVPLTTFQPTLLSSTETTSATSTLPYWNGQVNSSFVLPFTINTTMAGSTPPVINNLNATVFGSQPTGAPNTGGSAGQSQGQTPTDQATVLSVNQTPLVIPNSTNSGAVTGTLSLQFSGGSKVTVTSHSNGSDEGTENGDYQCTTLIVSYANQLGISGLTNNNVLDGKDVAQQLASLSDGKFTYATNGSTQLPEIGTVISIGGFNVPDKNGNTDSAGHVGIVQSVTMNLNGTVTLTLFDQNWPSGNHWSQVTLTKQQGGGWGGTMSDSNAPGGELTVVGWANPVGL